MATVHVNTKLRGRPAEKKRTLSKQSFLAKAKMLLRDDGKIPSIRKLASTLDVDAMALYHYFPNKKALLEAITTSLMEELYTPDRNKFWKSEVVNLSNSYLQLLVDHPGLVETLLSMENTSPAEVFSARYLDAIHPVKLTGSKLDDAIALLIDYLHGFVFTMNCNQCTDELTVAMAKGPLKLYLLALERFE